MLDLSKFSNQATVLTEDEVQALADSANTRPMQPGVHEVTVVDVPKDKVKMLEAPNEHLLAFNVRFENVSGETATVYCEISLDSTKLYKVNKETSEQNKRAVARHTATLLALGIPPNQYNSFVARIIATNGEALQGMKGFKAKLLITRNPNRVRLEYDEVVGAYFLVSNKDDSRVFSEPFSLSGTGKERTAEVELKCRELNLAFEGMPQVAVKALEDVDNKVEAVLQYGKVVNTVKAGGKPVQGTQATAKVGTVVKPASTVVKPATTTPAATKPVVATTATKQAAPVAQEEEAVLPSEEELVEDAGDYVDETEA